MWSRRREAKRYCYASAICKRPHGASSNSAPRHRLAVSPGDPALTEFRGKLHVFVCAAFADRHFPVQEAFELWDFVVDLDGSPLEAYSISAIVSAGDGAAPVRVAGTPSAVASHRRLQVFVRSESGRLVEFRSTDGQQWDSLPVSQGKVGGDAGAVLSGDEDSVVYASDPMGYLTEFREIAGAWHDGRDFAHQREQSGGLDRWCAGDRCTSSIWK